MGIMCQAKMLYWNWKERWVGSQRGQTLVEYGLLAALLVIAVIAVLLLLGPRLSTVFNTILRNLRTTT